jgi:hypothetical protein
VPARQFPGGQVVDWNDISPRFGVAYNLFGDGKTAIKFTWANIPRASRSSSHRPTTRSRYRS